MPNWCENKFEVSGDAQAVGQAVAAVKGCESLFATVAPMPAELEDVSLGWDAETRSKVWRGSPTGPQPVDADELAGLRRRYGTASWLEWATREWGTKWDVPVDHLSPVGECGWSMDTAWAPPLGFYTKFAQHFQVTVTAVWFESGMCFAGRGVWGPDGSARVDDVELPFGVPDGFDDDEVEGEAWFDAVTQAWYDENFM